MDRIVKNVILLNVILYASYVYLYFFQFGYTSLKPVYWYVLTIGSAITVTVFRPNIAVSSNFILFLILFLSYSIISFIISDQSTEAVDALIVRFESIALLLSFLILMKQNNGIRTVKVALLIVAILGVVINLIDFVTPSFSKVSGRAAGLYWNPNIAGSILVLSMVASVDLVRNKYRLLYCLFVGIGVLITFSRGGWALWFLSIIGLTGYGVFNFKRKLVAVALVSTFCVLLVSLLLSGEALKFIPEKDVSDFLTPNTVARLGASDNLSLDSSTVSRLNLAQHALTVFQQRPWFGYGLGFTKEWDDSHAPHNMFLLVAVEQGFVGLIIVCALLAMLWYYSNSIGRMLVILFILASMFSHNTLDQPGMLIFLSLIAAFSIAKTHGFTSNTIPEYTLRSSGEPFYREKT